MQYRAVATRCAIDLSELKFEQEESTRILASLGFKTLDVDVVSLAREQVGRAVYVRGVSFQEAPHTVDCSSFIKWLFAQKGIWLPRLCVQQYLYKDSVTPDEVLPGDVLYTKGVLNLYGEDPAEGVGHVGLVTGDGTVIHAAGKRAGVIEVGMERFCKANKPQGVRRFFQPETLTLEVPSSRQIESSDDITWLLLKQLGSS